MRLSNKSAFTLAEVLITLGIIGVVAAMTMPTLMNSTQGAQYRAAYKKALSALSQAVTLNVALDDYNFAQTSSTATTSGAASMYNIFKNRMNVVKTATGTSIGYTIKDAAGTNLTLGSNYTLFSVNLTNCKGFIDVNGEKNPNKVVKCENGGNSDDNCTVTNPTDVYPVVFYDQTVLPNSAAGRKVLYGK